MRAPQAGRGKMRSATARVLVESCRKRARAGAMVGQPRAFSSFSPSPAEEQQKHLEEAPPPPPNPPDQDNPDPATLREQWRYAISLYSKWYSHAWGTAILAGLSFFALGWFVKGGNPILSTKPPDDAAAREKDAADASE